MMSDVENDNTARHSIWIERISSLKRKS